VELWRSHHLLERTIGEQGVAALCDEVEHYLGDRSVEVPYVCRSWTALAR
jgi:hypothetical protein